MTPLIHFRTLGKSNKAKDMKNNKAKNMEKNRLSQPSYTYYTTSIPTATTN